MTDSEIAKGRIGLAAPISRGGQIIAGISLIAHSKQNESRQGRGLHSEGRVSRSADFEVAIENNASRFA